MLNKFKFSDFDFRFIKGFHKNCTNCRYSLLGFRDEPCIQYWSLPTKKKPMVCPHWEHQTE